MSKTIRGASHVPRITKGVYQIGGSVTGRMSYNQGPVKWQLGHVIVHPSSISLKSRKNVALGFNLRIMRGEKQHPVPRRREAIEHTRRLYGRADF